MKLVIMAGGFGTRLGDISQYIPKPMVEVGGKPILWHIMKIYSHYGIKDFILCLGYKANIIKDYFVNYQMKNQDLTINLKSNSITFHNQHSELDWNVTLVDTGLNTLKGGRLKRIEKYLDDQTNLLTYGDGVSDVNIQKLIEFHKEKKRIITITGVHPPARFGELVVQGGELISFEEKAQTSQGLINGGFMVFEKELLNYLTPDENCDLEKGVFEKLARERKISVYLHDGNWACVDHERDLNYLNTLWNTNKAFWRKW
jgi:glucose-1-phosphate cytidylyltransferase